MNEIILEDEEEGRLAIESLISNEQNNQFNVFDSKLCIVGHFITEGPIDFPTMQQTLVALWKPGKEKFCRRLFDTPKHEIVKPYGVWMKVPLRRKTKLIGERWLRNGVEDDGWNSNKFGMGGSSQRESFTPQYQGFNNTGVNFGSDSGVTKKDGAIPGNSNKSVIVDMVNDVPTSKNSVTVLESKKKKDR
ncbi:hypothetical protein POM88_036589 [Heracleum sosnowskyi]|uniref:DUF4283 domain-containing protein n=1 Tax=Heracleum sosnowskyi TaxID=360622 RepID=A0AAD8HQH4_9APIA|nr:hypothetical protein POM88_036589 [Heracleum sosnowskyi]